MFVCHSTCRFGFGTYYMLRIAHCIRDIIRFQYHFHDEPLCRPLPHTPRVSSKISLFPLRGSVPRLLLSPRDLPRNSPIGPTIVASLHISRHRAAIPAACRSPSSPSQGLYSFFSLQVRSLVSWTNFGIIKSRWWSRLYIWYHRPEWDIAIVFCSVRSNHVWTHAHLRPYQTTNMTWRLQLLVTS